MWNRQNIFSRERVSIILLLLISIRLIPFNLLHYHNGEFAGFKAIIIIADTDDNSHLDISTTSCTFHQFLDLINHGFFLDTGGEIIFPDDFSERVIVYSKNKPQVFFIHILNKGSPFLS
jgi:hypothetical protein